MIRSHGTEEILLNPERRSPEVVDFEGKLKSRVVGQNRVMGGGGGSWDLSDLSGRHGDAGRPIANLLFLGQTGSGKTRIVEAAAEALSGNPQSLIKID